MKLNHRKKNNVIKVGKSDNKLISIFQSQNINKTCFFFNLDLMLN